MIELRRCPSCHCTAKLYTTPPFKCLGWEAQIVCTMCGNQTPKCYADDYRAAVQKAADNWNCGWGIRN